MFPLNSLNSVIKLFFITVKGFEPATSCVRGQDVTASPTRHLWETGSLNWRNSCFSIAGSKMSALYSIQFFSISCSFCWKFCQIIGWCPPPPWDWCPTHLGNPGSTTVQWFIRFPEFADFTEFMFHLGKIPLKPLHDTKPDFFQWVRNVKPHLHILFTSTPLCYLKVGSK